MNNSLFNPGIQQGMEREYQAAVFHLQYSPALPHAVWAAGSSSEGVLVISWTNQQALCPGSNLFTF